MRLILLLFTLFSFNCFSQTVNILYDGGIAPLANIQGVYETIYGVGNVTITTGSSVSVSGSTYDIVIISSYAGGSSSVAHHDDLITYIQNGGHVVISTEGRGYGGGGRFMSSVWNSLTGQSVIETPQDASGTGSPPRFHNSNGPWNSSTDLTLDGGTGTYASFAGFHPLNVTHQRNTTAPTCTNIEGVSAAYPARPNLGDGTLFITGEVSFPFGHTFYGALGPKLKNHAEAIASMHYALLTGNQTLLNQLNTWEANLVVDDDFIGNDTTMCESDFIPFTRTAPNYASYSWEDIQGNVLSTTNSYTIIDSGVYLLRTTGTFPQCDGLDTLKVVFRPSPLSIFSADTVCFGTVTTFNNSSQISSSGSINTTTWSFGDGATSVTTSPTHSYQNSGVYNVQLTSVSDLGCSHDTTINVEVYAEPLAAFTIGDDCIYNNPVITESSTITTGLIAEWNWNFGDLLPATVVQYTDRVPSHIYSQSGSYPVTLIVKSAKGCDDTIVKTTIRHPKPEVSFTSTTACKNDSIAFTNTSTINTPGSIINWVWTFGDGGSLVSNFETKHKYTQDGFFNVTLIASSDKGCVGDITSFVQVFPLPVANFTSSVTCENANGTSFFNSSNISQGSISNYNWDFGYNGEVSTSQFANYSYPNAGTYNVELIVESVKGCKDTVRNSVVVNPKPEANFIADIKEGCFPYCTAFQDNSQSNATSINNYFWIFGNGEVQLTQDPTVCFENLSHINDALYNVTLIVTNDFGCKDTIIEPNYITVWPRPLADFTADPVETDMYNGNITFENISEGGDVFEWDYNDGNQSVVFEEEHQYADTGVFEPQLIVSTINGCKDTANLLIQIDPILSVYIPSAFTPDGDGVNDSFFIKGFAINYEKFEFLVFDRWGTLLYSTDGNQPWDGTYKGEIAPQDTYVYQVRIKVGKKEKEYRGHFTLLR